MRSSLLLILVFFGLSASAQTDLSGAYGFTLESPASPKDNHAVPGGRLVLLKMESNLYRFWLDVLSKGPEFDRMETDATLLFVNDTASFDNTFEDAVSECYLKFRRSGNTIVIKSEGGPAACGDGLQPDGVYTKLDKQPKLDNAWLKAQYPHAGTMKIASPGAEMYRDEDGYQSFSPRRVLSKGDEFLAIAETEKTIYTEMVQADGTLKYGWIRKSDIKMKD